MQTFLRLENLILPTAQIKSIATPTVNGESILEVAIFALTDVFKFDGQAAARAYAVLEGLTPSKAPTKARTIVVTLDGVPTIPVYLEIANETTPAIITVNGETINTDTIEWADLATDFGNGQIGVELRLSTDAPGITKQYLGDDASTAYDALNTLAPAQVATA